MSKTPSIDPTTRNASLDPGSSKTDSRNPLAELVAEFGDIDIAPTFKSLKDTPGDERRKTPAKVSAIARTAGGSPPRTESPRKVGLQVSASAPANTLSKAPKDNLDPQSTLRVTSDETANAVHENQIKIPERRNSTITSAAIAVTPSPGPSETADRHPVRKKQATRGMLAGAAAFLVIAGTAYLYVQGSQSASSETVVYEVPIYNDDITATSLASVAKEPEANPTPEIVTAKATPTAQVAESEQTKNRDVPVNAIAAIAPTTVALPVEEPKKQKPLGFNDKLSDEFTRLEGQSLLDLATGVAAFRPAEIIPDSEWSEVSCGGCHSFNRTSLCEQGAYYFNHDKARIARIQHPYGGGFKHKLMEWAEGGCK